MLHIINKSPFENNNLESCVNLIDENDLILLIEDGVIGATKTKKSAIIAELVKNGKVYALEEDLKARGILENVSDGIKLTNYQGFVDLVVEHDTPVSWL